jgi:hypothetical protein
MPPAPLLHWCRYPFKTPRAQKGPAKGPPEPMDLTPLPEVEKKLIDFSNKVHAHTKFPSKIIRNMRGSLCRPLVSSPSPFLT